VEAFKGRGDHGDGNDTKALIARHRQAARRARQAARLRHPRPLAHGRHDGQVDPAKAMELMMRVWPAAVARVREEVKDMTAIAKKERASKLRPIEPWDYLYYAGEGAGREVRARLRASSRRTSSSAT
jgi:peptidyl-dipeptidase Dcp